MSLIHIRVITPAGIYRECDSPYLNIQTTDGDRGLLPNHMPIVASLRIGRMSCENNGVRDTFAVAGGLLYFRDNLAEILTDAIEGKKEIDIDRAKSAKDRAERRLSANKQNLDVRRAQLALQRALNRISVAEI